MARKFSMPANSIYYASSGKYRPASPPLTEPHSSPSLTNFLAVSEENDDDDSSSGGDIPYRKPAAKEDANDANGNEEDEGDDEEGEGEEEYLVEKIIGHQQIKVRGPRDAIHDSVFRDCNANRCVAMAAGQALLRS